ncbi:hypothetical protein ACWC09_22420, partial [Streptomyces sp. NPDC001617]
ADTPRPVPFPPYAAAPAHGRPGFSPRATDGHIANADYLHAARGRGELRDRPRRRRTVIHGPLTAHPGAGPPHAARGRGELRDQPRRRRTVIHGPLTAHPGAGPPHAARGAGNCATSHDGAAL